MTVRDGVGRLLPSAAIARLVVAALRAAGAPPPASIGVILSADDELARLNREAMGHDGPTDVLSFPLVPPSAFPPHPGAAAVAERAAGRGEAAHPAKRDGTPAVLPPRFALPPGQRPHLGDIVVSVERAAEQARDGRGGQTGDLRWSPRDELRLLVVHGVLHVCGWDHGQPAERDAMRSLEDRILGTEAPRDGARPAAAARADPPAHRPRNGALLQGPR